MITYSTVQDIIVEVNSAQEPYDAHQQQTSGRTVPVNTLQLPYL